MNPKVTDTAANPTPESAHAQRYIISVGTAAGPARFSVTSTSPQGAANELFDSIRNITTRGGRTFLEATDMEGDLAAIPIDAITAYTVQEAP